MSRILSNDSSSKYSLSHSSKSVLTVSGLQFTTTVLLPSWRSVRILETAHQSNSTLLPARRQKSGQGKEGCREENINRRSPYSRLKQKKGKKKKHCLLSAQSKKSNCPSMETNHPQTWASKHNRYVSLAAQEWQASLTCLSSHAHKPSCLLLLPIQLPLPPNQLALR